MSTTDKLQSAIALIESYNQQVDKEDQVDIKEFQRKLRKLGGTTEDLLSELKWEDLEKAGLPTLIARKVSNIFRTSDVSKDDPKYVGEKKAGRMAPLYLIQSYNPQDANGPVAKRLRELSRDQAFLVFKNGNVDVTKSHELLQEVMKGFPAREEVDVDGKPVKVYAIGVAPGEFVDENPVYPGRVLRPDGTCDQTRRSWDGVPLVVRQLLYVAVTNGSINVTYDKAHELRDLAESPDAERKLRQRYSKASIALDDLIEANKAPTLKIKMGSSLNRNNNPFFQPHKSF